MRKTKNVYEVNLFKYEVNGMQTDIIIIADGVEINRDGMTFWDYKEDKEIVAYFKDDQYMSVRRTKVIEV